MFEQENIDGQSVVLVSIFGAFAVFVAIVLIQVVFYRMEKQDDAQKSHRMPADLASYQTEQQTALGGFRWVDKDAGRVSLPIERAMQLERAELDQARQAADAP